VPKKLNFFRTRSNKVSAALESGLNAVVLGVVSPCDRRPFEACAIWEKTRSFQKEACLLMADPRSKPATKLNLHELSQRIACDGYLTTPECAWYTHLGISTLKQMRQRGEGPPSHYISCRVLYKPSEVSRWAQQKGGAK
jgi:hypothetical protein